MSVPSSHKWPPLTSHTYRVFNSVSGNSLLNMNGQPGKIMVGESLYREKTAIETKKKELRRHRAKGGKRKPKKKKN